MRVAGILPCSLVNGEGIRYVIFLQGCPHHCDGCQNPDTWDYSGGHEMSIDDIMLDIRHRLPLIDGITLSGGEPFVQQTECIELLKKIKELPEQLDVWIYTGYKYEDIWDTTLASMANYIVDGGFEEDKLVVGKFYGSSNQRIIDTFTGEDVKEKFECED